MPTRRTVVAAAALAPVVGVVRARAQDALEKERDIPYGTAGGKEQLLDVHRPPARAEPRPAAVVLHGGGWGFGSRADADWAASELAKAGYVAFNVEYRLKDAAAGRNLWPAQIDDARRAVRWVRANAAAYGVDPARVASYGFSAGGHLAALLGTTDGGPDPDPALAGIPGRVAAAVAIAGDMDLTIPYFTAADDAGVAELLGGTAAEVPDRYRDASPLAHVDAATAPILVAQGGRDEYVPLEHGVRMSRALHAAGIDHVYAEVADAFHFDVGSWTTLGPLVLAFLGRHLRPER